ncbi:MAG: bifunctional diguanylate cyclase/phosphodiesterase [Pseudomonadota bacterium]
MKVTEDWRAYLSLGILLALCLPFLDSIGLRDPWYFMICFYCLLGVFRGITLNKSENPDVIRPWIYFLLSLTSQFIGGIVQANTDASGAFGLSLSIADVGLLMGHLFMVTSLWQFSSKLHREFPKHGFFQGWILATSLILVGWQFLFLPTILEYGFSISRPQTFRMIYPTFAYIEIGMLFWVWVSSEASQSKAFTLLTIGTVLFAAGESLFHGTSHSLGVPSNFNLILWLLAYVFFGAVAMHPDMKKLVIPRVSKEIGHVTNVLRLLLPIVLLFPVTLLIIYFKALHPATIAIVVGFFSIIMLGWNELTLSMRKITHFTQLLETQNNTDYLTGIPNRNHIMHVVGVNIDDISNHYGRGYNGLMLIDIDGFKSINNTFGFSVGDSILKSIAVNFYAESLKMGHHFARVDGDEFTLLMLNIKNRQDIELQAWRIHQMLNEPFVIDGVKIKTTCSIGISINAAHEKVSYLTMLNQSERALLSTKRNQSQVEVFDEHKEIEDDRSWVLLDFRAAITEHQLVIYYQPKVNVVGQKVLGVEALIRWQHPKRGLLAPNQFLPHIETTDLIHAMFTSVLNMATRQWRTWSEQGLMISIALNVTARDLMNFDLANEIKKALMQNNMPASYLEIEITESSALSDPIRVKAVLKTLMELGVEISIDDYGTGYSSLLYLQQLPLNYLKIDQQFIKEMLSNKFSEAIVRSTLELAKNLNIDVIAEGVEDKFVYQQLKKLGCYGAQGYLFSQPVSAEKIVDLVKTIESADLLS